MTPTQLRSFRAVVQVGTVCGAAAELGISQAAVSANVASLRRELDDPLFRPSRSGLQFTAGGIRLSHRADEILRLQELTISEIANANDGRRLLHVATTSFFAEYAAPGLLGCFATKVTDVDVELIEESADRFQRLLETRRVDVAIGPSKAVAVPGLSSTPVLRCDIIAVGQPHVVENYQSSLWLLGPSAMEGDGVSQFIVSRSQIPEAQQRIYASHAAAVDDARSGRGIALVPAFAVAESLKDGSLVAVSTPQSRASPTWTAFALAEGARPIVSEVLAIATSNATPRAIFEGGGSRLRHFKPLVHITRWS